MMINLRLVRIVFACLFCIAAGFNSAVLAQAKQDAFVTVTVADSQFGVTAPDDQCLYPKFSKLEGDPAILFFGACSRAKPSGLFSLSIGAVDKHQSANQLKTFFQSTFGKAALAQSKQSDGVTIESSVQKKGILFLRLTDKSGPLVPLTEKTVWRALFQQSDHFISVAYLPLASQQISPDQAFDRLYDFAVKFKRQNIRWIPAGLKKANTDK